MIDIKFNFTTDTPNYWKNFWDNDMGHTHFDPDLKSKTLMKYHSILWSKRLPNGEDMHLTEGRGYLVWKDFSFGSDSITNSFRNKRNEKVMHKVMSCVQNYREFVENYLKETNTIGGYVIFPKKRQSINQARGCNYFIGDRFDLTLECIRRYYNNEQSPLYNTLVQNKDFFDLFSDFKGYVEFFLLQDIVDENFKNIKFWLGEGMLDINPLPQSVEEYLTIIEKEIAFVKNRNERIKAYLNKTCM